MEQGALPVLPPRARRWQGPLRMWSRNPVAAISGLVLAAIVVTAIIAPVVAPYSPDSIHGTNLARPSPGHLLGLDYGGHDTFSVLVWGSRTSLKVGFAAAAIALFVGGAVGMLGGYFSGAAERSFAFLTDFFLVIPVLPLMITIATLYGTSETTLILIIGLLSWMSTARVVRAQVKSLRERPYVRRTRALGATHTRILVHHILPQIGPLLAASAALALAVAILSEAALSFLGLGPYGQPSWGSMIALNFNGGAIPAQAWWVIIPPGVAIGIVILCATLIARSFESALNPRLLVSHLGRHSFRVRGQSTERFAKLEAMLRRGRS